MYHDFWFYDFIRLLPTIQAIEDPTILKEIEITLQIGNKISATRSSYNDETFTWTLY
jgi:hypothetical protein